MVQVKHVVNSLPLSIGDVATRAGVSASAIRYYERRGLLPAAERVAGQRRYGERVVRRLKIIDVAKQANFTLSEIRLLLDANDAATPAHEQLHALGRRKLTEVNALLGRTQAVQRWLTAAESCTCDTLDVCALFAAADDHTPFAVRP